MAQRVEKRQDARPFTFRMPQQVFDTLSSVAKARAVDVSSVLNWVIAESLPHLLEEKVKHEAAMLAAASSKVWARQSSPGEALQVLRDLLAELQDEYARLVKRALEEGDRRAA